MQHFADSIYYKDKNTFQNRWKSHSYQNVGIIIVGLYKII